MDRYLINDVVGHIGFNERLEKYDYDMFGKYVRLIAKYRKREDNGTTICHRLHFNYQTTIEDTLVNDKWHGKYYVWNVSNGKIHSMLNYKNGKQNGLQFHWGNNGELTHISNFKNDILDGITQGWSGGLYIEIVYSNGRKISEKIITQYLLNTKN